MTCRKIKFEVNPTVWNHHRGGWSKAFDVLKSLYAPDGVLCLSSVEDVIGNNETIEEPWVGFIHQVPKNNWPLPLDNERLIKNQRFLQSLHFCQGIFTLSNCVKRFLVQNLPKNVPVVRLFHPTTPLPKGGCFDWEAFSGAEEKKILMIGMNLRDYQAFFDLAVPTPFKKYLLKLPAVDLDNVYDFNLQTYPITRNQSVSVIDERVSNEEYDDLLHSSIVFLRLFDAAANNTVIECLSRGTPLLVNRLPGIVEYLGNDYPLFYDNLDDATALLSDKTKLLQASKYMNSLDKSHLQFDHFLQSFANSSIYRSLPLPVSQQQDSQQTRFPKVRLSIMICSYKRVYNLKRLLESFKQQDCEEDFEIILWNNNPETQKEVADIVKLFENYLQITLIQSSKNYYCIVRLAIPKLMRSDLLLICDDDVVPNKNYVSTFLTKFKKYGPRAILCFRGDIFGQHSLNEEEPHLFWKDRKHIHFCGEDKEDCQVCELTSRMHNV